MDFLECKICNVPYDEEEHRPRHAPCGHELCSACIQALITESIFQCPKCRQKNKVDVPDDLPVSFGLIDVIRAFKNKNISMIQETEPRTTGATNDDVCKAHHKVIRHRCMNCEIWICEQCLHSHSKITGCSTVSSSTAVENLKKKCTNGIEMVLTAFGENVNTMSTKIQEHTDQRSELLNMAAKHSEEIKKIHDLLEKGEKCKDALIKSKNQLCETHSPYAVMDKIEMATQMKQSLHSWYINNLGIDPTSGLPKALKGGKDVYVDMTFKGEKRHGKLSHHGESTYFHSFHKRAVEDGAICMPFDCLQKIVPADVSLVFFELSLGGNVEGKVLIRLDKGQPTIREHFVQLATGKIGQFLIGTKMYNKTKHALFTGNLGTKEFPITPDRKSTAFTAKRGDVLSYFGRGFFEQIFFYVSPYPSTASYGKTAHIFGNIEEGMDIIQECFDYFIKGTRDVMITDSGIVIEQN